MGKHSTWRKQAKKAQRKRRRRTAAIKRDELEAQEQLQRQQSPSYELWLIEQQRLEEFQLAEELRISKEQATLYQLREKENKVKWNILQEKLKRAQEIRVLQNIKIKQEWEAEQTRLKALKEEKEKQEELRLLNERKLQAQIDAFLHQYAEMPEELNTIMETHPGKVLCPFFARTAACRFGDTCSRNHQRPTISTVLLIRNFYSHYSLDAKENEHGDLSLECENQEIYAHFREFFNDVMPEFATFGTLQQLRVCCNKEPHLRGNVYVEYASAREAMKSYRKFHGRFYGGRQLNVEFCRIDSWKSAICGLFHRRSCPKGSACNFLHVFHNPGNVLMKYDEFTNCREKSNIEAKHGKDQDWNGSERRNWRWSSSPEIETSEQHASKLKEIKTNDTNLTRVDKNKHYRRLRSRSPSRHSVSRSRSSSRSTRKHDKNVHKTKRRRSRSRSNSRRRKGEENNDSKHQKYSKRR